MQSLSWISLNYLITFVLTSGRPSPTLIEAGIKNFWLSMVFSYGIWIGISLSYCFTGQTDISKAFLDYYIVLYYYRISFIFIEKDLLWKIFDKKAEMRYPSWKTFLSQSDTVESEYYMSFRISFMKDHP